MFQRSLDGDPVPVPFDNPSPVALPAASRAVPRRRRGVPSSTSLVTALISALLLAALGSFTTLGATTYTPKCDDVNLRTGKSTTYKIKTQVDTGALITVVKTVSGGSYQTKCNSKSLSGSDWHKISAINGVSVSSLYGVSYLFGASKLFKTVTVAATAAPTTAASAEPSAGSDASPSPGATAAPTAEPTADPGATEPPDGSPAPSEPPAGPIALPDTITFHGRGWGHGVGMSQYGAHGRALAGQSAGTILSHYYKNTTMGSISNVSVRVLVLSGFRATPSNPLQIFGRGGSWSIDGIAATFPADARLKMIPTTVGGTTSWQAVVNRSDGTTLYVAKVPARITVRPGSGASLQLWSKPSAYDRFRGTLRVIAATGSTASVRVVNHLSMETYLKGVVPAEVSASWPAEVVKAQAIAARSYAGRRLHPDSGQFDLYDDTRHQVYRGMLAEKSGTNAAISATAGKVRRAPNGSIANTLFHSTGGGATEHNENVFVSGTGEQVSSPVKYLRGSMDRQADGAPYDEASNFATWRTHNYTLAQIQKFFGADSRTNVGTLVALDLTDRGVSGRLVSVTLIGAN
ncbi:MAG TPA: SpoIID/LytB domain-containing protein, partial [Acidimicrobiia bacterium]|nr:SpoIID/LytB domain-containing protein [Acidimicrobiia bacterium]